MRTSVSSDGFVSAFSIRLRYDGSIPQAAANCAIRQFARSRCSLIFSDSPHAIKAYLPGSFKSLAVTRLGVGCKSAFDTREFMLIEDAESLKCRIIIQASAPDLSAAQV